MKYEESKAFAKDENCNECNLSSQMGIYLKDAPVHISTEATC